MSCNISIPLQRIIDDVAEAISGNYISVDNPFLNEAVLTDTTFRGDITLDTEARNALCLIVQTCSITADELEWLSRPTEPQTVAVNEATGVVWRAINTLISWGDIQGDISDQLDLANLEISADKVITVSGDTQEEKNTVYDSYAEFAEFEKFGKDTGITAVGKRGGVDRPLSSKLLETVSIKDHGAIGDGELHPISEFFSSIAEAQSAYPNVTITALTQTLDWVATQSALNSGAQNIYAPEGTYLISDTIKVPKNVNFNGAGIGYFYSHPVTFLLVGVGNRNYIMDGVTDTVFSQANPSVGAAYLADSGTRGDVYKLNNFAENFSVGIELQEGSQLTNIFVTVDNNGVAGYTDNTRNILARGWDVGILCHNANSALVERVWSFGHFAKSGILITAHTFTGDMGTPSSELLRISKCGFSGLFGVSLRTADTIVGNNWGFGGTVLDKCYIRGIEQNARLATSSYFDAPFDRPSGAVEISGGTMRGISFNNCTLITRQDINIIAGKCTDINFNNSYLESKQINVSGSWIDTSTGSRFVTSPGVNINFRSNEKYGVDFSPNMTRESSVSRYSSTDPGVNSTSALIVDDNYTDMLYQSYSGVRLRRSGDYHAIADSKNQVTYAMRDNGEFVFFDPTKNPVIARRDSAGATQRIFWISATSGDIQTYGSMYPAVDRSASFGTAARRYSAIHADKFSSYGTAQAPTTNGEMVITIKSDTEVGIKVKGSDGVIRSAVIALA